MKKLNKMAENNLNKGFWMMFWKKRNYDSYSDMVLKNLDYFIVWSMFLFIIIFSSILYFF